MDWTVAPSLGGTGRRQLAWPQFTAHCQSSTDSKSNLDLLNKVYRSNLISGQDRQCRNAHAFPFRANIRIAFA